MKLLYEGKAKQIYETENPNEILMHYKDDATAFNGLKKDQIHNKGILNNKISTMIFGYLNENGIETHLIKTLNERDQLCKKVEILPLEVIVRNYFAGSASKRLGIEEGVSCKEPIFEICYKCDELNDPLINDTHAIAMGIATREELNRVWELTAQINQLLIKLFDSVGVRLIDFKIEFGKDADGKIMLADEISPDSCRLWDKDTNEKLDKDRFRREMGNVEEAYIEICKRLTKEEA